MWRYQELTRDEFEKRKDFVEHVLAELGAEPTDPVCPHSVSSCCGGIQDIIVSSRPVFTYQGRYYRVDEVLFPEKPFIVIECADRFDYVINNAMEDADPFPHDLSDRLIIEEIRALLN